MNEPDNSSGAVLEARNLVKEYRVGSALGGGRTVFALSGVDLAVKPGETLAIVGESGCGKSTLARCLTGLHEPTSGYVLLDGADAQALLKRDAGRFRRAVQIVFQDPYASLNPRRTIGQSIDDGLRLHKLCARSERRGRVGELLSRVGLSDDYIDRYPHELSGGQRQRVAIARALAVAPRLIICDEPVSALDVSVQAQIINLLNDLQEQSGVAYVFISHNLALVRHISDRIAVMYLGQIVEIGDAAALGQTLVHPYSRALFGASPEIGRDRNAARAKPLEGDVPSPLDPPTGCRFHTRCPFAQERCTKDMPSLRQVAGRDVRCHRAEEMTGTQLAA
jgi:oligopeptide/dipeptide ABC transporter ATP-binding protein